MDKKQIETYVYDKKVIKNVLLLLEKIKVEGTSQATILATVGDYIDKPIKEDTTEVDV